MYLNVCEEYKTEREVRPFNRVPWARSNLQGMQAEREACDENIPASRAYYFIYV